MKTKLILISAFYFLLSTFSATAQFATNITGTISLTTNQFLGAQYAWSLTNLAIAATNGTPLNQSGRVAVIFALGPVALDDLYRQKVQADTAAFSGQTIHDQLRDSVISMSATQRVLFADMADRVTRSTPGQITNATARLAP